MKKMIRRMLLICTAVICMAAFASCGGAGKENSGKTTPTQAATTVPSPTSTPTPSPTEPPRDLKGLNVTLVNSFVNPDWKDFLSEAQRTKLQDAEEKHNFVIEKQQFGGWGNEYIEGIVMSIENNNPVGSVMYADSRFFGTALAKSSCLNLAKISTVDWNDDKWNQTVREILTINGKLLGFSTDKEPGLGVYFNKDLLEKQGISADTLYDLQKEEKWNWETFLEFCGKINRDSNNDRKDDVWPVTGLDFEFANAVFLSNGTSVLGKTDNGLLKINAEDKSVLEAIQFISTLRKNSYSMPKPTGKQVSWDWQRSAFMEEKAIMYVGYESNGLQNFYNVGFSLGFVTFPYGPSVKGPVNPLPYVSVYFLPNCEKIKSNAEDIMFAYDLYLDAMNAVDDDAWKKIYTGRHEERAVAETLDIMFKHSETAASLTFFIPSIYNSGWEYDLMSGMEAEALIKKYNAAWAESIEQFNALYSD